MNLLIGFDLLLKFLLYVSFEFTCDRFSNGKLFRKFKLNILTSILHEIFGIFSVTVKYSHKLLRQAIKLETLLNLNHTSMNILESSSLNKTTQVTLAKLIVEFRLYFYITECIE